MAVPQRARSWLAIFAFSAALALGSPWTMHSGIARTVKRTSSLTRHQVWPSSPRHLPRLSSLPFWMRRVQRASTQHFYSLSQRLKAGSRANAKNHTSSAVGLLQFTKQTWLENLKKFGGKHGLSYLAVLIHRSGTGYLVVHAPARNKISALRYDPRIATLAGCGTFGLPTGTVEGSASASRGLLPHPCVGNRWSQPVYRGGIQSSVSAMQGCCW